MNYSLFSSFDAVLPELLGCSVRVPPVQSAAADDKKIDSRRSEKTPPQLKNQIKPSKVAGAVSSGPRFAPELDGLNCFETLIF
ncbi:hypothetical protein ABFS82_05G061500 [Erythranthe guttata]